MNKTEEIKTEAIREIAKKSLKNQIQKEKLK